MGEGTLCVEAQVLSNQVTRQKQQKFKRTNMHKCQKSYKNKSIHINIYLIDIFYCLAVL